MRILAGEFGGRKLLAPSSRSITRPITGLAKKSLFDILAPILTDAHVADIYCGTGTLGLEALSRGASRCRFVERDSAVVGRLKRNIDSLNVAERCDVFRGDAERLARRWLEKIDSPLDLIFVDPPYAQTKRWDWRRMEGTLFLPLCERAADDAVMVLRTPASLQVPARLAKMSVYREKRYGQMAIRLYGFIENDPTQPKPQ